MTSSEHLRCPDCDTRTPIDAKLVTAGRVVLCCRGCRAVLIDRQTGPVPVTDDHTLAPPAAPGD